MNPFIYNYASEEFRSGFRHAVGRCWPSKLIGSSSMGGTGGGSYTATALGEPRRPNVADATAGGRCRLTVPGMGGAGEADGGKHGPGTASVTMLSTTNTATAATMLTGRPPLIASGERLQLAPPSAV